MNKKMKLEHVFKDIIEELRSFKVVAIIFITNVLLLVSVASIFYSVINSNKNGYATNYKAVLYMYNNLIFMEFVIILVIIPLIAGFTYAREYENGTLELLLLTKVKTSDILVSKIIKCLLFSIFLVITSLPMFCVVFSVGGVTLWDIIKFFIVVVSTSLLFGSIGMYFSTKYKNASKAILYTYITEAILSFGTTLLFNIIYNICDKIKNRAFYSGTTGAEYDKIQFSFLGNLLLSNPLFNLYKLQSDIVGNTSKFDTTMNNFGINAVIDKMWIFISVSIQIVVIIFVINKTKKILFNRHHK